MSATQQPMSGHKVQERLEQVQALLDRSHIRLTEERRLIVKRAVAFLHFTAEELVKAIHTLDPSVARATVYRTLALLQELGVVEKHDFRYGAPNYELTFGKAHHDHLMCIQCGEIIEFQEPRVETLQQDVVQRYGYELVSHTHKLYGLCRACRRVERKIARRPPAPNLHVEKIVA